MIGKGLITRSFGGLQFSNDGTKTTILGIAGDYIRIGDAAVTSEALNSEDDLMVTGELEVDGSAYFEGSAYFDGSALYANTPIRISNGYYIKVRSNATAYAIHWKARDVDGTADINMITVTNADDPTMDFCPAGGHLGFFGATAVGQQAHVADPTGGATQDAEARTAINAINAMCAAFGLTAAS